MPGAANEYGVLLGSCTKKTAANIVCKSVTLLIIAYLIEELTRRVWRGAGGRQAWREKSARARKQWTSWRRLTVSPPFLRGS
jgi:hypothetical protein